MTDHTDPGERGDTKREERNAVQGQWVGGRPGNAAPMPATTTATPHAPLTGPDRRDREELTDRDDLAALLVQHQRHRADCLCGWDGLGRSLPGHQADAILAAGWVHWPLHPTVDKLTAALNDERELHRDTRAENASLRRRLVEAGALDPAESVRDD